MFQLNPENPALAPNLISRIRHGLHKFLKTALDRAGLPGLVPSHGLILGCLYTEDQLPMNRIAQLIGRRKSTLTVLADKLERRGYIQREASAEDNRVRRVSLTAKGEEARAAFENISHAMHEKLWQGFSEEEKAQTMRLLHRMSDNLSAASSPDSSEESSEDADNDIRLKAPAAPPHRNSGTRKERA